MLTRHKDDVDLAEVAAGHRNVRNAPADARQHILEQPGDMGPEAMLSNTQRKVTTRAPR